MGRPAKDRTQAGRSARLRALVAELRARIATCDTDGEPEQASHYASWLAVVYGLQDGE